MASGPAGGAARRRGGDGAQVPGSGFVVRPRRSAPRLLGRHRHHPSPQAAGCRARAPRSSAPDPLPPGAGAFVPLTNRLHHAGRGEGKPARPAPASSWGAPQSGSSLNDSQSGNSTRGWEGWVTKQSAKSFPPPCAWGHPNPRQTNQRAGAAGSGPVPSPSTTPGAFGACRSRWPLSGWRVRRMAGRRSRTSKVTAVLYLPPCENVAGGAAGGTRAAPPPHAGTGSAARPAPPGAKCPGS